MLTSEAAERLKITKRSVARLCKAGTIKAQLRGRDYWIEDEEVERYAKERRPAHRPRMQDDNPDIERHTTIGRSVYRVSDRSSDR